MSAFPYNPVLAGDEDMCLHDGRTIVVLPNVTFDSEGESFLLECDRCHQVIEKAIIYE